MKVVQRNKLQTILRCFSTTNSSADKSITTQKMQRKLHFSLAKLYCFRAWSMEDATMERKQLLRCSLQDLFVSSPPESSLIQCGNEQVFGSQIDMYRRVEITGQIHGLGMYHNHRFRFANLRKRLLRRSNWRPALGAIPE